jgi:cobalt-zinc-cadmium efflux system protein
VVNLVAARLFGPEHRHDLNRRAAVVHLLTDAAVMGAVLVSAVLVHVTGRSILDAATAIGVGLVVAWNGLRLLAQALAASLDGVPAGVDLAAVEEALASMPEVAAVQELHVWGLSTARTALAARLRLRAVEEERTAAAVRAAARQRLGELGIGCSILELEPAP